MLDSEYIVAHGCAGSLGRFRALDGLAAARGDDVVIRGRRGLEVGTVLGRPIHASLPDEFIGDVLRTATPADRKCTTDNLSLARQLCIEAEQLIALTGLPFTVLDAEVLLEGRSAILHGLSF